MFAPHLADQVAISQKMSLVGLALVIVFKQRFVKYQSMGLDTIEPPATQSVPAKRSAFVSALLAVALPVAAFALAWLFAGKIPFAVPTRDWGIWFFIGPLLGLTGIAGLFCAISALARKGFRALAIAGLVINPLLLLIAWAGLFG